MDKRKARGQRGQWWAEVDGERLPCVHAHWVQKNRYNDPGLDPQNSERAEFVAALKQIRRVIVCKSDPIGATGNSMVFVRRGYIAAFSVDRIEFDAGGLRFEFGQRIYDLE